MLTKADTVKKLPQLSCPTSSRTRKESIKKFSVKEPSSLNKVINWPVRDNSSSPLLIRKLSPDPRLGSVRGRKTSDEDTQQLETQRSKSMLESPVQSYSKSHTKEHRHRETSEGSGLQLRHKATITSFPFDPPFNFQLTNPPSKDGGENEDEVEQVSPSSLYSDQRFSGKSNACESVHEHQHRLQPQRFSPTPSFDSNDHNIHGCPFYTNEVSNLKLQIIELECINAILENKVRKYRDEIRLFKQDIKGFKIDGRQFAELLTEKENEIETLNKKIAQLLNQDTLPLMPGPRNGGSYKRHGQLADLSVKRRDFGRTQSTQDPGEHIDRAETDIKPRRRT